MGELQRNEHSGKAQHESQEVNLFDEQERSLSSVRSGVVVMRPTEHYDAQIFTGIEPLGAKWQFPSDHIPVAAQIGDFTLASFNVLNGKYAYHFEDDKAGLAHSQIIVDNIPLAPGSSWTKRDEHALALVLSLTSKVNLVVLQECSPLFLEKLKHAITTSHQLLTGPTDKPDNQIACVVNTEQVHLHLDECNFSKTAYQCRSGYSVMDLKITSANGLRVQVLHTHVPGDPNLPGVSEFGQFIKNNSNPEYTLIAIGDMNFPEANIEATFGQLGLPGFERLVLGNTSVGNFNETTVVKDLDHILLFDKDVPSAPIDPSTLSHEVEQAYMLLNGERLT